MSFMQSPAIRQANDQLNVLRGKYYSLPERDRLSIIGLSVFLGAVAFFYLIWAPTSDRLDAAKAKYNANASTLSWLKANESAARRASGGGGNRSAGLQGQSILTVVNKTAAQKKLQVKKVEPKGDDSLRVWFDDVSFNDLMAWVHQLSTQYGISAVNVSLDHKDEPGIVKASFVIKS